MFSVEEYRKIYCEDYISCVKETLEFMENNKVMLLSLIRKYIPNVTIECSTIHGWLLNTTVHHPADVIKLNEELEEHALAIEDKMIIPLKK